MQKLIVLFAVVFLFNITDASAQNIAKPKDQMGDFVAAVLGNTEDIWSKIFKDNGQRYSPPRLVLFSRSVQGDCGVAETAMGPFYCPKDRRIYLDPWFFLGIRVRFKGCGGATCEFVDAYMIAREVGHHVQNLLGILPKAQAAQSAAVSKSEANHIAAQVELQADCFAGVWAHHSNRRSNFIAPSAVEAALQTAAAIGDDRLQQQSQDHVVPEEFTHGTSEQRQRWFTMGLEKGEVSACDTFASGSL